MAEGIKAGNELQEYCLLAEGSEYQFLRLACCDVIQQCHALHHLTHFDDGLYKVSDSGT